MWRAARTISHHPRKARRQFGCCQGVVLLFRCRMSPIRVRLLFPIASIFAFLFATLAPAQETRQFTGAGMGEPLVRDKQYLSPGGSYYFSFLSSGDLIVARSSDNTIVWKLSEKAAGLDLSKASTALVNSEGFAIFGSDTTQLWSVPKNLQINVQDPTQIIFGVLDTGVLGLWNPNPDPFTINTREGPVSYWRSDEKEGVEIMESKSFPLTAGTTLQAGEEVASAAGNHVLIFNPDGNLVVARNPGKQFVWGLNLLPGVSFQKGKKLELTSDGQLALLDADGNRVWSVPESGAEPGSQLELTADGVLQVVKPDGGIAWGTAEISKFPVDAGRAFERGDRAVSQTADHALIFGTDGNVVVARYPSLDFVWGLNLIQGLPFAEGQELKMTPDGRLTLSNKAGGAVWSVPETNPTPGSKLELTAEGILQVVRPDGSIAWAHDGSSVSAEPPTAAIEPAASAPIAQSETPAPATSAEENKPNNVEANPAPVEVPQDAQPFLRTNYNKSLHGISAEVEALGTYSTQPQIEAHFQNDQLLIAWQNHSEKLGVKISAYKREGESFKKQWRKDLPGGLARFAGLTADGENYYVLTAANEDKSKEAGWQRRPDILKLIKLDPQGSLVWEKDLNANEDYTGTPWDADKRGGVGNAVYSPMQASTADIAYGNNRIAIIYGSNSPYDPPIKSRHQSGHRLSVKSDDGSAAAKGQPYSWKHSFDQRVAFDGTDFVLADQPDAGWFLPGPGIALVKILNAEDKHTGDAMGWYVYTRNGENNFSSINIGNLAVGNDGYLLNFSAIRDSKVKTNDQSRNLGLVHVVRDFTDKPLAAKEAQRGGGFESIIVDSTLVDTKSKNPQATGDDKFQSTNSSKSGPVQNTGIVWLTDYKKSDGKTISRPKVHKLDGDKFLVVAEEWAVKEHEHWKDRDSGKPQLVSEAPQQTVGWVVREYGQVVKPMKPMEKMPLRFRDKLFGIGDGTVGWVYFDGETGSFTLTTVDAELNQTHHRLDL